MLQRLPHWVSSGMRINAGHQVKEDKRAQPPLIRLEEEDCLDNEMASALTMRQLKRANPASPSQPHLIIGTASSLLSKGA